MYAGRFMKKENKNRNRKSIVLLVSVFVLIFAMVGGTLAYLAAKTTPVENKFTFGSVPIDIPEKFDGTTKTNAGVRNDGKADAFVRAKIVVTWKKANGEVSGTPVKSSDYSLEDRSNKWQYRTADGFYYYTDRLHPGDTTENLIGVAKKAEGVIPPEGGFDLSIEILAQSVQADGVKDGKPMVEAIGWPVTATPSGQHPTTITIK